MKLIACIKQVPASSNVAVDPDTGVLIRDGDNVKMNPYDLYALELGCRIKEQGSNVSLHTLTMGPPSARRVLQESLYMGADECTLVTDRRFAGADVLATSYTLSQAIRHIGDADLILCGKQTTDGDTAQVGPEIAEFLGIPHIPYVIDVLDLQDTSITVKSVYDAHEEIVTVSFPCLITVEKGDLVPRLPSYRRKLAHKDTTISVLTLAQLPDVNPDHYGLSGSPTQVEEIFPPDKHRDSIRLNGSPEELAAQIISVLGEHRFW
jgi:electron transfer flavoprotein beta subunit